MEKVLYLSERDPPTENSTIKIEPSYTSLSLAFLECTTACSAWGKRRILRRKEGGKSCLNRKREKGQFFCWGQPESTSKKKRGGRKWSSKRKNPFPRDLLSSYYQVLKREGTAESLKRGGKHTPLKKPSIIEGSLNDRITWGGKETDSVSKGKKKKNLHSP